MALDAAQLETDLEGLFANASIVPATQASNWVTVLSDWVANLTPPSTTIAAAGVTLQAAITTICSTPATASATGAALDAALQAWAAAIGLGMTGFTATPPPLPPNFQFQLQQLPWPPTHAASAALYQPILTSWITTGTAYTLPSGPTVPWT